MTSDKIKVLVNRIILDIIEEYNQVGRFDQHNTLLENIFETADTKELEFVWELIFDN
jgi:hypothetical protein